MSSDQMEDSSRDELGSASISESLLSPGTDSVALVMKVVLRSSVRSSVQPKVSGISLPFISKLT